MKDSAALTKLLDKMEAGERETLRAKGADYSDPSGENRLANFERIAGRYYTKFKCSCGEVHRVPVSPRLVLAIYREKHIDAFRTWACGEELQGEPLSEKLKDDRNYAALARLMDESDKAMAAMRKGAFSEIPERFYTRHFEDGAGGNGNDDGLERVDVSKGSGYGAGGAMVGDAVGAGRSNCTMRVAGILDGK